MAFLPFAKKKYIYIYIYRASKAGRPDVVTRYARQARAIIIIITIIINCDQHRFCDSILVMATANLTAAVFLLLISAHTGNEFAINNELYCYNQVCALLCRTTATVQC